MARLEISEEIIGGNIHVLSPKGKLDVFSFVELRAHFEDLSQRDKKALVVVDLSGVEYVASSGWSVLLSRRKLVKLAGGDLSVCGMSDEIKRVYESMKIQKLLPSAPSAAAAAKLLDGAGAA
jgi:anti-anti-sigma factor